MSGAFPTRFWASMEGNRFSRCRSRDRCRHRFLPRLRHRQRLRLRHRWALSASVPVGNAFRRPNRQRNRHRQRSRLRHRRGRPTATRSGLFARRNLQGKDRARLVPAARSAKGRRDGGPCSFRDGRNRGEMWLTPRSAVETPRTSRPSSSSRPPFPPCSGRRPCRYRTSPETAGAAAAWPCARRPVPPR